MKANWIPKIGDDVFYNYHTENPYLGWVGDIRKCKDGIDNYTVLFEYRYHAHSDHFWEFLRDFNPASKEEALLWKLEH